MHHFIVYVFKIKITFSTLAKILNQHFCIVFQRQSVFIFQISENKLHIFEVMISLFFCRPPHHSWSCRGQTTLLVYCGDKPHVTKSTDSQRLPPVSASKALHLPSSSTQHQEVVLHQRTVVATPPYTVEPATPRMWVHHAVTIVTISPTQTTNDIHGSARKNPLEVPVSTISRVYRKKVILSSHLARRPPRTLTNSQRYPGRKW